MSTKAIRKALRDMQCDYNPCLSGMCRKHEALAEIDAVERAARDLVRLAPIDKLTGLALGLMDNINNEASK